MSIRKYERRILKHKARTIGVKESAYVHAVYSDKRADKKIANKIKKMSEQEARCAYGRT